MNQINTLIPSEKLRVAINFGNAVLAQKISNNEFTGISVILAEYICKNLGIKPEYHFFKSAGDVVEASKTNAWDIAFLARDKERAKYIGFTSPYVVIEGAYLVNQDAPYRLSSDMDKPNLSLSVGKNAAYDLFLSRTLKSATIVRAPTTPSAVDYFIDLNLDAAAGVRAPLLRFTDQHPQYRVLDDSFMTIQQAVAFHHTLAPLRNTFQNLVEEFKSTGLARDSLDRTDQTDALVAESAEVQEYEVI